MKRIVALLLGLLMVFTACSAMAETVTVNPGDQLSFNISLTSASGTNAKIGIDTYDAPVELVAAAGGPANDVVPPKALNGYFVLVNADGFSLSGSGALGDANPSAVKTLETGVVGTVTLKVSESAPAGSTYTVAAYAAAGSVTVDGSITFTIASGAAPGGRVPGDANEDGSVDIFDALLALQYDAGWNVTINTSNADVNADGYTDIFDALILLQYDAGWNVVLK